MTQEASWYMNDDGTLNMDKCGTGEGYLLVFDRSEKTFWKEKIFKLEKTFKRTRISVYGM